MIQGENYTVHIGNNLDILPTLEDNLVDSIVTDPPYELGFMGKKWDSTGIAYNPDLWRECLRVLKPGGHLLAFSGSRTYHRMVVAIEDAGFEIRDMIAWISNKTFPKSHNLDGDWKGWGTALKPTVEPIVMARKPLVGTVAENVLTYGTGGLNIDGSRIGNEERTHAWAGRSIALTQERTDTSAGMFAGNVQGQTTVQGRWPANVILDEHTAELLDEQTKHLHAAGNKKDTGQGKGVEYKSSSYRVSYAGIANRTHNDSGGASRFFYVAKASKRDRNEGLEELPSQVTGSFDGNTDLDNARKIGADPSKPNQPRQNFHPTVKPTDLMRYLIKLVTPPNGIVLDPFTGSGSTGKAAILEGFRFIGIEMTQDYIPIIEGRLKHAEQSKGLF